MYITEMLKEITPTSWLFNLYTHSRNETDSNLFSRLELAFLLESGALISIINIPTFVMITHISEVSNHDQQDTWKTLSLQTNLKFQLNNIFL